MDLAPSYSDVGGDEHEYEYENKYDVINDANGFAVDDYYYIDGSAENTEVVILEQDGGRCNDFCNYIKGTDERANDYLISIHTNYSHSPYI